jgi:hypothetical protein
MSQSTNEVYFSDCTVLSEVNVHALPCPPSELEYNRLHDMSMALGVLCIYTTFWAKG